jgi:hypothetical protein
MLDLLNRVKKDRNRDCSESVLLSYPKELSRRMKPNKSFEQTPKVHL